MPRRARPGQSSCTIMVGISLQNSGWWNSNPKLRQCSWIESRSKKHLRGTLADDEKRWCSIMHLSGMQGVPESDRWPHSRISYHMSALCWEREQRREKRERRSTTDGRFCWGSIWTLILGLYIHIPEAGWGGPRLFRLKMVIKWDTARFVYRWVSISILAEVALRNELRYRRRWNLRSRYNAWKQKCQSVWSLVSKKAIWASIMRSCNLIG